MQSKVSIDLGIPNQRYCHDSYNFCCKFLKIVDSDWGPELFECLLYGQILICSEFDSNGRRKTRQEIRCQQCFDDFGDKNKEKKVKKEKIKRNRSDLLEF